MKIDIMTIFPEQIESVLHSSIIGRGIDKGLLEINAINIRDYSKNKHRRTDDSPYGGSPGMVMTVQPLFDCHSAIKSEYSYTIYLSPGGRVFTQDTAKSLLNFRHLILVCGHYEGIDQRFIDLCVDAEISIGDFVLTGGELPAMVLADSICRLVPGVLSDNECFENESHYNGLLEHPHYTRPEEFMSLKVPDILLSGHHANIKEWRYRKSLEKTKKIRPDMYNKLGVNNEL